MKDGEVYTGHFKNLKRHGQGECTYPGKKMKYQGQWEQGSVKGSGTYVNLRDGARMSSGNSEKLEWMADGLDAGHQNPNLIGSTDLNGNNGILRFDKAPSGAGQEQEKRQSRNTSHKNQTAENAIAQHEEEVDEFRNQFEDDHGVEMAGHIPEFKGEPANGVIATHRREYFRFCRRRQRDEDADTWAYAKLEKGLQEEPIYATKYSHNLEGAIMNHFQYECRIQLSKDGKTLEITNRKLSTAPSYRTETTPDEIRREEERERLAKEKGFVYVPEEEAKKDDYMWQESSSTCRLSDIQGIIYGGHSSRFWIYRKHMIAMDAQSLFRD